MSIEEKIARLMEEAKLLEASKEKCSDDEEEGDEEEMKETKAKKLAESKVDVSSLFEGEEFSDEFKKTASELFNAAVDARVQQEVAALEEQFSQRSLEESAELKEGLVEKVDGYLNYVVEQWMTDNEIALENGLKNEIMESFIVGMKDLFEQHYIDVPQEKYDLIGNMQEEIEGMKSKLDEQLAANVEMKSKLDDMVRKSAIDEVASEMVATDAEKFRGLAEELSFDELESFKSKLQTIKENYFGQKPAAATVDSVVTDTPVQQLDEDVKQIDPIMARYVSALKKS